LREVEGVEESNRKTTAVESWRNMELLSAVTGTNWTDLEASKDKSEAEKEEVKQRRAKLDRQLLDVLLAENLVVLTGLGTSLCIKDSEGKRLAPSMADLWESAAELPSGDENDPVVRIDDIKSTVGYVTPAEGDNIELLLSRCQMMERLQPNPKGVIARFINNTEVMIAKMCRLPRGNESLAIHEMFLRKVARRSPRLPRMRLFTTNYDLCFESAASRARFVVTDGFSHTQPQEFDGTHFDYDFVRRHQDREVPDYIPNVFHLYKLHGSLDWKAAGLQIIKTAERPLIIYPRDSKFEASYDQPFLEMMSRLQIALRQPNTGLLVIGFGFNDHHIAQPILSAMESNVGLKAVGVSPDLKERSGLETPAPPATNSAISRIASLIRAGDWRLSLLAASFEELTAQLPDLVAGTEEEQHSERVRNTRGGR